MHVAGTQIFHQLRHGRSNLFRASFVFPRLLYLEDFFHNCQVTLLTAHLEHEVRKFVKVLLAETDHIVFNLLCSVHNSKDFLVDLRGYEQRISAMDFSHHLK
jgi:hypothetical protein